MTIAAPFEEPPSEHLQHMIRKIRDVASSARVPIGMRVFRFGVQDGNILLFAPPHMFRDHIIGLVGEFQKQLVKTFILILLPGVMAGGQMVYALNNGLRKGCLQGLPTRVFACCTHSTMGSGSVRPSRWMTYTLKHLIF